MAKAIPESSLLWAAKGLWGPMKWTELHGRALAYLPMDKESEWFASFVESIPCPHCQKHFELFVEENPPSFESRPKFFAWTVAAHNYVRRAQQKPEISLEEALSIHFTFDCASMQSS